MGRCLVDSDTGTCRIIRTADFWINEHQLKGGSVSEKLNDPTALLTVNDVARLLNLKPASIYKAVERELLPAIILWRGKRRKVVRFRQEDIEAFLCSSRIPAKEHVNSAGPAASKAPHSSILGTTKEPM